MIQICVNFLTHFLILIFGHLQARSREKTKSETFFCLPFTTLSSVLRKIAFTWSVNFTDSALFWSSMDFVWTTSRAITLAMIAVEISEKIELNAMDKCEVISSTVEDLQQAIHHTFWLSLCQWLDQLKKIACLCLLTPYFTHWLIPAWKKSHSFIDNWKYFIKSLPFVHVCMFLFININGQQCA